MARVLPQSRRTCEFGMTLGAHPVGLAREKQGGRIRRRILVVGIVARHASRTAFFETTAPQERFHDETGFAEAAVFVVGVQVEFGVRP
jgi:hypothetical protein